MRMLCKDKVKQIATYDETACMVRQVRAHFACARMIVICGLSRCTAASASSSPCDARMHTCLASCADDLAIGPALKSQPYASLRPASKAA